MKLFLLLIFMPTLLCLGPLDKIAEHLTKYIQTGEHQDGLREAIAELLSLPNKTDRDEQVCATCRYVVDGVIQFYRSGIERKDLLKLVKYLCHTLSDYGTLRCNSLADMEIDAMLYMLDHRKNMTSDRVCSIYFQERLCRDPDENDWNVKIPSEPENITYFPRYNETDPVKILHLTDIHVDPLYTPGSDADCGKPLCCQGGTANSSATTAGYWGDYHVCDMPWHSVHNLLDRVKSEHNDVAYVYFTGDIIAHTWETTKVSNSKVITQLMQEFKTHFPTTIVFPILGNHEAHPSDYYAPLDLAVEKVSTQWLFDLVAEEWADWLPSDARDTIKRGGYYTVLVKKGFRIIGLNSNVCYVYNLWLMEDDVDPYGQLQWLVDTLAEAERMGEVVHILSHIPPGGVECWKVWVKNYNRIVRRFSRTIKAQFNGHTHMDELRVFLDEEKKHPLSVAYNGGSFTTFVGYNPNYRVYDIDPQSYDVLDYKQWIYNVTAANLNPNNRPPNWYLLYSFREAYGMNGTNLADLYDLTQRMQSDKTRGLLKQYRRFLVREGDATMKQPCDDKCLDNLMCSITSVDFSDAVKCV